MKITADYVYKFMLALLLFIPVFIASAEINIVMAGFFVLFVIFDRGFRISDNLVNALFPLFVIFAIGFLVSFFYPKTLYDFIKDVFFFLKPILFVLLGYYLVSRIENKDHIFKLVIYLAFIFAFLHLIRVGQFLMDNPFNVNKIRSKCGKANYVELLATVLIITKEGRFLLGDRFQGKRWMKLIILVSAIFYFSRTMLIGFIILFLALKGLLRVSKKGVTYFMLTISAVGLFYLALSFVDIDRESKGISGLLYKIKIAPSEIFSSEINKERHSELWDHWRGYEATKALEQLADTKFYSGYVTGKGFGALVDLEFLAPLSDTGERFIPTLHNGYAYILYKTGIIGLVFFLIFIIFLYMQAYTRLGDYRIWVISNMIMGFALFYAFTALIINGIYNHGDIVTAVLGALLYLKHHYKVQILKPS